MGRHLSSLMMQVTSLPLSLIPTVACDFLWYVTRDAAVGQSLWMMLTSKFIARFFVRCVTCGTSYLWQSCVEMKGYSVAYFDRIIAFEAPYC